MVDGQIRQTFDIYDPHNMRKLGEKLRTAVHSDGDWHLAVTAFIFRGNTLDDIEVLVQERSQYVDIAQKHFDQSLATQLIVEDGGDTEKALIRGLREELDISKDELVSIFKWNKLGDIYISKRYIDNPELWNREIVTNYFVRVKPTLDIKKNFKVQGFEWLPWMEFCDLVRMQPNNFTKSVRIYTVIDSISEEINELLKQMVVGTKPCGLAKKIYYLSLDNLDLVGFDGDEKYIEVYKTAYTMRKVKNNASLEVKDVEKALFVGDRSDNHLLTTLY